MSESDKIHEQIQNIAFNLIERLEAYKKTVNLRREDFAELTLMLLDYWSLDDDLSTAKACEDISTRIEDKVIELAEKYDISSNCH